MYGLRDPRFRRRLPRLLSPYALSTLALSPLTLFVLVPTAQAVTLAPDASIQAAIDASAPGDTLELPPGVFNQSVTLRDGIAVTGAGPGITFITGVLTVPADVSSGVTLSQLTASTLTSAGQNLRLEHAELTGTATFEGAGSSAVSDSHFRSYLVGRGQARVSLSRVETDTVAFTLEQADVAFEDSSLKSYLELRGSSQTIFRSSTLSGVYLYDDARAELEGVMSTGVLSGQGRSEAEARASQLGTVSWAGDAFISLEGSTVSRATFLIDAAVDARLEGVGPGYVATGSGSATGSAFGASIVDSTLETVALDIYGELELVGGGYNGYSFVRDGAAAHFDGITAQELLRVIGTGSITIDGSSLAHDVELYDQALAQLAGTHSTAGALRVMGNADAELSSGTALSGVFLGGAGSLHSTDSAVSRLSLMVEEGRSARIEGLAPGVGTGIMVQPGATDGPSLTLNQGDLKSIQLWVRGEADVVSSTIDDYMVVEGDGVARATGLASLFYLLTRDNGSLQCTDCTPQGFLTADGSSHLALTGGVVYGHTQLLGNSRSTLSGSRLEGAVTTTGSAVATLSSCTSSSQSVTIAGSSHTTVAEGSDLYAVVLAETGQATLHSSQLGTLTLDVAAGRDLRIDGLRPGLVSGLYTPEVTGPSAALEAVRITTTSILVRGTATVSHAELNGYTFVYEGAEAAFTDTTLRGVSYLLPGSATAIVGGRVEGLFRLTSSSNRFDGVRFVAGTSLYIGGASFNTFTRCVFEQGIALQDQSHNNFGEVGGNPGENDFSTAQGYYRLANYTANPVMAQQCSWGSEDADVIGLAILDSADDAALGPVRFDPFLRRNQPPRVFAGDDRMVFSYEQELVMLVGSAIDPEGDPLTYRWLLGDEVLLDSTPVDALTGQAPLELDLVAYLPQGEHLLTLEVTEEGGVVVTDEVGLTLNNSAPVGSPSGGGSFGDDDVVFLGGEVADYDGDLLSYTWWLGEEPLVAGTVQSLLEGTPVVLPEHALDRRLSLGVHQLTLEITDGINEPVRSNLEVEILDQTPPTLSPVVSPSILWPPNGKLRDVTITTYAMDAAGGAVTLSARVSSNEPPWRISREPDWTEPVIDQATGIIRLKLRADRQIVGNGRNYTIWITAVDAAGNSSESRVTVRVPRWGWDL